MLPEAGTPLTYPSCSHRDSAGPFAGGSLLDDPPSLYQFAVKLEAEPIANSMS